MARRSKALLLNLPPEFVARCEADGWTPRQVLTDFIADLCGIEGSNGSDERDLAQSWYGRRGYPHPLRSTGG